MMNICASLAKEGLVVTDELNFTAAAASSSNTHKDPSTDVDEAMSVNSVASSSGRSSAPLQHALTGTTTEEDEDDSAA